MTNSIHYNPVAFLLDQPLNSSLCQLGVAAFEAGNLQEAKRYFEQLSPTVQGVFYAQAVCLARMGDLAGAAKLLLQEMKQPQPHPRAGELLNTIQTWFNQQLLTLFAMPKPFRGPIGIIQRNAIKSWTLLRPRPDIILFGQEEGTAEIAHEFGLRYVPQVQRNEFGTPLVNDLFMQGQRLATSPVVVYINADIILTSDFIPAVQQVAAQFNSFLMIGQRWDFDIATPINFEDSTWELQLRETVTRQGSLHPVTGIDYYVFTKGIWPHIPPFAIGRTAWDNWLVAQAQPVIDATQRVMAIHQNHDYAHLRGGEEEAWNGVEAQRNKALAGQQIAFISHATWQLTATGLLKKIVGNEVKPLKFMQVHTFYQTYLEHFYTRHPALAAKSFDEQMTGLIRDGFSAIHMFSPYMPEFGYRSQLVIANCTQAQLQWLREHNFSQERSWTFQEVVQKQIEAFEPDVLYLGDPILFDSRLIRTLSKRPPLILGWRAAMIPQGTDWSEIDVMLSSLTALRETALQLGAKATEHFFPGFPEQMLTVLKDEPPQFDVVFSGSIMLPVHAQRRLYLHQVAQAAAQPGKKFTCAFYLHANPETLTPEIAQYNQGVRWGVEMLRALRSGKIVLDVRGDIGLVDFSANTAQDLARQETANMRIFEVTGSGALLLAEYHDNLKNYFELGKEIETFKNAQELIEKIHYYLAHPEAREAIAKRGQQRCWRDYSMRKRAEYLHQIIHKYLKNLNFPTQLTRSPMFWDDIKLVTEQIEKYGLRKPLVDLGGLEQPVIADYELTVQTKDQQARFVRLTERPFDHIDANYLIVNPERGDPPIEQLPAKYLNAFGTGVCLSVLEHVQNPFAVFQALYQIMQPNSLLIISTIFAYPYHPSPDDYWRFSPACLRYLSEQAGFTVLECDWRLRLPANQGVLAAQEGYREGESAMNHPLEVKSVYITLTKGAFTPRPSGLKYKLPKRISSHPLANQIISQEETSDRKMLLYTDDLGEAIQHNHAILGEFIHSGYHVTCVQVKTSHPLISQQAALGIQQHWLAFDPVEEFEKSLTNSQEAYQILASIKPDLIIFSDACPFSSLAAKQVAVQMGVPFITLVTFVAHELAEMYAPYLDVLARLYSQSQAVLTFSPEDLQTLRRYFRLPASQGRVINNVQEVVATPSQLAQQANFPR